MRFLADESCDYAVVRALSRTRHEVLAVADLLPGVSDGRVIELALRERCILLTEDKDSASSCTQAEPVRSASSWCGFRPAPGRTWGRPWRNWSTVVATT